MNIKKHFSILLLTTFALALLLCGCGNSTKEAVNNKSVTEMAELIKSSVSFDYIPDMAVDEATLESLFGLTPDMYEDYFCEMPMISVKSDMLMIVKPKEGQTEAVRSAMQTYLDYLQNDAMMYPMNAIQVQATEIYEDRGYLYYIGLFGDTTGVQTDEDQVLALCKERVQEVKKIIGEAK